uniref:Uncharacterized protein n=1 Tax=viral metagenome TaxID=1070528 RepID=A0A6C0JWE9_9ZZZZ
MRIKVLVPTISYTPVLEYYNSHKDADEEPLQVLDRAEGGFKIDIPERDIPERNGYYMDSNYTIQQLRWENGFLKSMGYIGFSEKQTLLLYHSIANAIGENNVLLI